MKWFMKSQESVINEIGANVEDGLTTEEVAKKQEKYGLNKLKGKKKKQFFKCC